MEFPFGHTHNHHHRRRNDSDEFRQPPPPFPSSSPYPPPHQPPIPGGAYPPPPEAYPPPQTYPPPPAAGVVSHVHHSGGPEPGHHRFEPHMPGFIASHIHHGSGGGGGGGSGYGSEVGGGVNVNSNLIRYFGNKPTHKIYCKAGGDRYTLAVRDGKVVLAQHNANDPTQHWYKDEKYSTKVKDSDGYPAFSLVNKATGQAVKHSVSGHPVKLIPYKPDEFDESILWTESEDLGSRYRTIRMVNNVKLCMDAFHGDKDHGGVHDGTTIALYDCWKGDNQKWKIVPYCKPPLLNLMPFLIKFFH